MKLLSSFRSMVLLSVTLVCLAYAVADSRPWIALLTLGVVAANWVVMESGGRGRAGLTRHIPRWVVYLSFGGILLRGLLQANEEGPKVSTFCEFVVLVLLFKIWDRRSARDYSQILTLSVFLSIGAMLTGVSLAPSAVIVVALPVLLVTVMMHQIYAARERALGPGAPPRPGELDLAGHVRWGFRFLVAGCLVVLLGISVVVFVSMPRASFFDQAMSHEGGGRTEQRTGFTDRVRLGQAGLISESTAVVMEVLLEDPSGETVRGQGDVWYLRGAVLDEYQDGEWYSSDQYAGRSSFRHASPGLWENIPMMPGVPHAFGTSRGRLILQHVKLYNTLRQESPIFSLWRPQTITFADDSSLRAHKRTGVLHRNGQPGSFEYTVASIVSDSPEENDDDLDPEPERGRPTWAWASFPNPRVRTIAEEILRSASVEPDPALRPRTDDARAARLIENYLRRNFTYTLDIKAAEPGVDPIEWFLTTGKSGHCAYFASCMTALCRSVGIPARVITGYAAAEVDDRTGGLVVRERNAHAWVEALVGEGPPPRVPTLARKPGIEAEMLGWRTYDPTPPDTLRRLHEARPGLAASVGRLLDTIEFAWNSKVVSYDERQRERFFRSRGIDLSRVQPLLSRLARWGMTDEQEDAKSAGVLRWAERILGAAAFVGGLFLLRWLRRRRARAMAGPDLSTLPEYYRQALRQLRRLGVPKPPTVPPLDLLASEAARVLSPGPRAAAEHLVRAAYAERFGGAAPDASGIAAALRTLRAGEPRGGRASRS